MDWQNMQWHDYLSFSISLIGVIVIVWGVVRGLWEFVRGQYITGLRHSRMPLDDIRYDLGRYLLLGLEFFIAGDVVHTVIQPGLEEVAVLASIVVIRTIISYFLTREMIYVENHMKEKGGSTTV